MLFRTERYEFASDNAAPVCPEAWTALREASRHHAASYGEDRWTFRVCEQIREIFETDCEVFFVFTGTAANALALAQVCEPFRSIVCHKHAHIQTDECGAPEFFTGGSKLLLIGDENVEVQSRAAGGKIHPDRVESIILRQTELHSHKPGAVSISQATEFGTIYRPEEIAAIADVARAYELFLHMDGARFANAIASLNCAPKAVTWQVGVDVLCFGGTKNGAAAGELVVFFDKEISRGFEYRLKQAGQLGSKMRFLAAPWLALLSGDVWLRNARHANRAARQLAKRLQNEAGIESAFLVEANAVFVRLHEQLVRELYARGWRFYKFMEPDVYRLMCSWATADKEISEFVADVVATK